MKSSKRASSSKPAMVIIGGVPVKIFQPRNRKGFVPISVWREAVATVVAKRKKPLMPV